MNDSCIDCFTYSLNHLAKVDFISNFQMRVLDIRDIKWLARVTSFVSDGERIWTYSLWSLNLSASPRLPDYWVLTSHSCRLPGRKLEGNRKFSLASFKHCLLPQTLCGLKFLSRFNLKANVWVMNTFTSAYDNDIKAYLDVHFIWH
jgi:hypothetical protein